MKIAMLGWEFPPFQSGGLGVHCYELTARLGALGHEVDFFMPITEGKAISPHKNVRIIEVAHSNLQPYMSFSKKGARALYGEGLMHATALYNSLAAKAVAEQHKSRRYDVMHAHDWLTSRAAGEAAAATSLPLVHTFHSTEFDRTSQPWDFILDLERRAATQADLLIGVSKRTADQMRRLGADSAKIRIVYNGVDASKYNNGEKPHPASPIGRMREGESKLVLFLGRLTEQKGPVQFLHAAKKVLTKNPNVRFIIAGKGELLPMLINLSISLGLQNHVKFLGYVGEEEQRRIYSACDLYVMPSTSEPFGITALEAMASGTPVIVSKTSGVSEVARSAVRVDFWDINGMAQKMLAVLSYPSLRSSMVRLERSDVGQLTWEKCAEETVKVYSEAISKAPAAAKVPMASLA